MSEMANLIKVTRTSTSLSVYADIDALLREWGDEKTALFICMASWMHKVNQLDEIYQLLVEHDNEEYATAPIWMVAGLLSEGSLFFAKDSKVSTYFRGEISTDLNLREAVDALQKFHSKAATGLPQTNMIRYVRNKYSFHPNEYKAVIKALEYWRIHATGNGQLREMQMYRIDCDKRPHFDASGCDALYLLGLFDIASDRSLLVEHSELMRNLGKDIAKLRNLTGSFFICLGEYFKRQQS